MKPLILVPYRDRRLHLDVFLLYMRRYFGNLRIAVIEQADLGKWNKGLLFNAGYKELAQGYDYLILHDVDFLPNKNVDYVPCDVPTMIAGEASQFDYKLLYPGFFGGVVVLSKEHYELVNGFSNQFRGYGGEDDLFKRSFEAKGIQTGIKNERFECFAHPRPKNQEDYQHNLKVLEVGRDFNEGLSTAQYEVVSKTEFAECIHLRIKTEI